MERKKIVPRSFGRYSGLFIQICLNFLKNHATTPFIRGGFSVFLDLDLYFQASWNVNRPLEKKYGQNHA